MSVLIDMEMPRRCIDCCLSMWVNPPWVQCMITGHKQTLTSLQGKGTRPDWCPLEEYEDEMPAPRELTAEEAEAMENLRKACRAWVDYIKRIGDDEIRSYLNDENGT